MADAFKCDGCLKFEEGYPARTVEMVDTKTIPERPMRSNPMQLCDSCAKLTLEFFRSLAAKTK
jgi:hypothetical protein